MTVTQSFEQDEGNEEESRRSTRLIVESEIEPEISYL